MIRLVRLLQPAAGISNASLDAFRRDTLGPLVAAYQTDLCLSRYVQTHRCSSSQNAETAFLSLRLGADNDFVGAEEFWWNDEAVALDALTRKDGRYSQILQAQDGWIDAKASFCWLAVDYPQVSAVVGRVVAAPKSGIMKLMFAISPLQDLGEAQAHRYWLTAHGPMIRSLAPARGALAYIQVHRQREGLEAALHAGISIPGSPFMGHAEAWFNDAGAPAGADALYAVQAAVADERKFIDWSQSFVLVGKELVFVDRNWL